MGWIRTRLAPALGALLACVAVRAADVMTNQSVIDLHAMGMGEGVIVQMIDVSRPEFDLSIEGLKRLKASGVPDGVITTMMKAMQGRTIVGADNVDRNDPMAPHPSGIYLYEERGGERTMTPLEPAQFTQTKSSRVAAVLTPLGLGKAKLKGMLAGERASVRARAAEPVFYFYFDVAGQRLSSSHHGWWGSVTSPNEFVLVQPVVKGGGRELVYGQANAWGSQEGTMSAATRPFRTERVADGVYRVTAGPLESGEYIFYAGAGATGGSVGKLFDFGVDGGAEAPAVAVAAPRIPQRSEATPAAPPQGGASAHGGSSPTPPLGHVVTVSQGSVYADAGTAQGVQQGDRIAVLAPSAVLDAEGRFVAMEERPVGEVLVEEVWANRFRARVASGSMPSEGCVVRTMPRAIEPVAAPGSTAIAESKPQAKAPARRGLGR